MEENGNHPSEQSTKGLPKSTKGEKLNVYVWDMDETIILLTSLLNGTYAKAFYGSKDVKAGEDLGKIWENKILDLCDHHFFYEQLEDYNQPFLDALRAHDDGRDLSNYDFDQDGFGPPHDDGNKRKLAFRQRAIATKYREVLYKSSLLDVLLPPRKQDTFILTKLPSDTSGHSSDTCPGLQKIYSQQNMKFWEELYERTDVFTDRWFSSARAFMEECSSSHHVNVLVTSGSLIPSLVKCLLFRLDNLITPENVYSSWEVGKLQCFKWIKERFNESNVRFCVIGDGWEECEAAQSMKWPFVKIDLQPGSAHRFPGLSLKTLSFYFSVIYGNSDSSSDEEKFRWPVI